MDLVNKVVIHKAFGEGTVIEQDKSSVCVKFAPRIGTKKFAYPDAFDVYLKLKDTELSSFIDEEVQNKKQEDKPKSEAARQETISQISRNKASKSASHDVNIKPFTSADDFCLTYNAAIEDEISFLRNGGGHRLRIFNGEKVEQRDSKYIYIFETDDELNYPESTQITIHLNSNRIYGIVIGCEEFTIIFSTEYNLGDNVLAAELSAEPWHLLEGLTKRISDLPSLKSPIVRSLICDGYKAIDRSKTKPESGQDKAIRMALTNPVTFIWGPPGTGKTETLAKIALEHIKRGNRVLMVSYSNVSVDSAVLRTYRLAYKQHKAVEAGDFVRYGYPRDKELLNHDFLTSYNLAIHNHPELLQERDSLIKEQKTLPRNSQKNVVIRERLNAIRKKLKAEETGSIGKAMFLATTVSKAIVDSALYSRHFDVVIFDEASMAYIPQIVYAASLANKSFVCMGDFKQLPPIVQSSNSSILNADIFQYCGIASAINEHVSHKWLCLLDTQYRMHSDIADFASVNMYNNLLHTYEGVNDQREDIKSSLPSKDTVISFADLSGMMSVCTKTADNSRINVLSAFITLSLALQGAKKHEVGIITPYRSQSRLIHAMIRDVLDNNSDLYPMSCATVHQFQGSEKDIIIYDAVDCYRMSYPGTLLVSKANNYADRLFNVALTRAKGKFVAVANMSYMEKKKLPKDLMFTKMMAQQKYSQSCHRGAELISDSASFGDIISFFDDDDGWYAFLSDLSHAKQEVTIDIPAAPVNSRNLVSLVDKFGVLKTHGVKVIIRAEKKETLPSCMKPISIENKGAMNPVAIIDKKLVWFGMPQSDADFVSENVVIKSKYHPIIRFPGKYTARTLYGFLGMSNTVDQDTNISRNNNGTANSNNFASYVFSSMRCPDCGKPMKLNKSKKTSKYFIGCSDYPSCKHTELVTAEFVEDYLYRNKKRGEPCPQCGCSLTAKRGKYGIYVECFGVLKHKYGLDEI